MAGIHSHQYCTVQTVYRFHFHERPADFLRDLRFPPDFKIGTCLERSKHPFTQDVWGAAVLKVDVTIQVLDRIVAPNKLHA